MNVVSLSSRDFGGSGPPLVILHGMLGSSRNWATAGRDLAERGRRVFALDLRNHGSSPHAPEMDYRLLAADVAAWLDREKLGPVVLLGHSMGGKTAMRLACDDPARVERLVVVDIAPKDYRWVGHRLEFQAMLALDLSDLRSRAEAEMRMEGQVPDWALRKFLTTNLERDGEGRWHWTVNLPVIAASLPRLEVNSLAPADRYGGPTLFIAGGDSRYLHLPDDLAAIRAHFPRSELEVIAGSGHNPHFDRREDFVAAVIRFTSA